MKYLLTEHIRSDNHELHDLAKTYDSYGYISKEVGEELESLFDNNYIIGIHRTGYSDVNDAYLKDVFNNGLINNMDRLSGGFGDKFLDINKTVTLFYDFIYMNMQLKTAGSYKCSSGSIIIKIPKSYLGLAEGEVKPIYYQSDDITVKLLSEYVYGYIPVKDGVVGDIIHNPNYRDEHTYIDSEDVLLYESKTKRERIL